MAVLFRTVSILAVFGAGRVAAQDAGSPPAPSSNARGATGSITGHVVSARGRQPMGGITVEIQGSSRRSVTDAQGGYVFDGLPPGAYSVEATTPDGRETQARVVVSAGATAQADITAATYGTALNELVVLAQRTPVAIARLAQKEAPNVVNIQTIQQIQKLPDISTAEAVRRVPGISLETDEGEGRYVNIRGLDADLNSTTFGGLRLPPTNNASPFGGYRAVTLDSIPIGLVGAITVTKSNLPSQDAEALGGTIEITPRTAPPGGQPFLQGNIGTGYEPLRRGGLITDLAINTGGHFGGPDGFFSSGPFSIVLTASYYEDHRGIDDVEPAYINDLSMAPHQALGEIQQRDYELNRKRHSYGISLGYEPDANNSWYIRAFDAGYTERYKRQFLDLVPDKNVVSLPNGQLQDTLAAAGAIQKSFRDEDETSRDRVFMVGGRNKFGDNIIDYRVGYTEGAYHKPYDYNSAFTLDPSLTGAATITYNNTGPGHVPVYTIGGINNYLDPTHYLLTGLNNSTADNFDREFSVAGNYERLANLFGSDDGSFKTGFSVRLRHKRTTAQPRSYATAAGPGAFPAIIPDANGSPISLTQASGGAANETYYGGLYQNGADVSPGYLQSILGSGSVASGDQVGADQQYLDAREDIFAGYGEYQASWGRFGFIAGVRVEHTQDRSNAFGTSANANGVLPSVFPVAARTSYTNAFPSVQLKYEIQPDLIARATYSSTIARPGFNQSNVALSVDLGSGIVTQGNPNLKPEYANSFDVTLEKYLPNAGIISVGFFDKEISSYIVPRVVIGGVIPGLPSFHGGTLQFLTFSNAPSNSYSRGVELNFEHRFTNLPGLASGLGFSANFTYVDSRIEIRPGEFTSLPSSSKYTYNAAIFYEKGPLNLRLAAYSTSADIFGIGSDKTSDVYNAARTSMDLGGSYAFSRHWQMYVNAKNLLNTPHAFYEGTPDRPIQREFYWQTYQLGFRFDY
jgi:TonB-dependent receptor